VHERGRDLRVGDFIRDEIASIIQREMRDPRVGMVVVNDVHVSRDLSWADVYVTSIEARTQEEREALLKVLNNASGYFRSELAKRHSMRTTPKPRFHYDESVERGPRLEALIGSALEDDARQHAANENPSDAEGDDRE
jgi:ribosome-binding factor A